MIVGSLPVVLCPYHSKVYSPLQYVYALLICVNANGLFLVSASLPRSEVRTVQSALEPVVSAEIMELHHKKHHQTYVTALNAAAEKYAEVGLQCGSWHLEGTSYFSKVVAGTCIKSLPVHGRQTPRAMWRP